MLHLTTIKVATSKIVLDEPLESLINFVYKIQQKDTSIYIDYNRELTTSYKHNL